MIAPQNVDLEVPLNRALFSWVLENLIRNAVDAMEGEDPSPSILFPKASKHIDISDTGKGMPPAQFRRVFEPASPPRNGVGAWDFH
ncbi:MAG: HAMP domain-containing histidine kinase [Flavobacteriales bacterium]|nr:HAMP domain-containing histidine kinase [Flavobacteriales bacterium]